MLYGFLDETSASMVIVAAETMEEFETFGKELPAGAVEVDAFTMLIDSTYRGIGAAYRVSIGRASELTVTTIPVMRAADTQRRMARAGADDPYSTYSTETRTIAEINGLDKHDPWDNRSDEEKDRDEKTKQMRDDYKEAKKRGGLSGESFSPNQSHDKVGITDIRAHRNADGSVEIDEVLAQKGLWADREAELPDLIPEPGTYWSVIASNAMGNTTADIMRDVVSGGDNIVPLYEALVGDGAQFIVATEEEATALYAALTSIFVHVGEISMESVDQKGMPSNKMRIKSDKFKVFYRIDLHGISLARFEEIAKEMPNMNFEKMLADQGEFDEDGSTGVWLAAGVKRIADKIAEAIPLADTSVTTEVYAVNRENERLVPKGTIVVDVNEEREIGPRPWNARAAEWHAWTDEQRAEEIKKNVKGDEFYYAGSWMLGKGSYIYIVPKDYFAEKGEMFDGPLPISHLLPIDIKEDSPGVYVAKSRDWNHASFAVGQSGIRESMMLRLYLNNTL